MFRNARSSVILLLLVVLNIILVIIFKQNSYYFSPNAEIEKCKSSNLKSGKLQCWENLIDSSLRSEGIDKTFDTLEILYKTEPEFAEECHSYTHKIGEEAFRLFSTNQKDKTLSPKSFYCGYGYYHGFMETMLHTDSNLDQARQFCKYAGEKLKGQNNDAEGTCYHGIGHGVVDGSDPRTEGNAEAIIQPGLELCKKVAPSEKLLNRCSSGVFNSIAIMFNGNQHNLSIDKNNPLWLCAQQKEPTFKLTCYQEMNTVLLTLEKGDFKKAVQWIKNIPEEENAISAMDSLGQHAASFRKKDSDQTEYIHICQEWPDKFRLACIRGFSVGMLLYGTPGEEYVEALKFCNSSLMTEKDKDNCLERLTWGLYNIYPYEKFKQVCKVEEKFMKHCTRFY